MTLRSFFRTAIAVSLLGSTLSLLVSPRATAQNVFFFLTTEPITLERLESTDWPDDGSVITDSTISQTQMTIPSLWWTRQQFASKLLNRWVAFSGVDGTPRRVDMLIHQPVWNRMSYVERYSFVNRFGRVAAENGYNIRVFNPQENLLAAYFCSSNLDVASGAQTNFRTEATNRDASKQLSDRDCNIVLRSTGAGALDASDAPVGGL
jgi:hypothetical protein